MFTAMLFTASCNSDEPTVESNVRKNIELDVPNRTVANNLCDFYLKYTFYATDYVDKSDVIESKNVVLSPLSASFVLAMAANAVEGDVRQEITEFLGESNINGINTLTYNLLTALPNIDKMTTILLANSVWANKNFTLNDDFSSLMSENYLATSKYFDPNQANKATTEINQWCAKNTNNLINDFLSDRKINSDVFVIMLNAMYFKSSWGIDNLFNKADTKLSKFHGISGESLTYIMKSSQNNMKYYADDDFEFVRIPFGNEAFNFEILLPKEDRSIYDVESMLTPEKYTELKGLGTDYSVTVNLPKFKINNTLYLNDILTSAGIPSLNNRIKFSLFTDKLSGIGYFNQATSLEINETGAEASSATSFDGEFTSPVPTEPVNFNVDRPFYFFITEQSTGACIVSGRIVDLGD